MEDMIRTALDSASYSGDLLGALYVMAAWTAVTWMLMTVVRVRAMNAAGMAPDTAKHTSELTSLPRVPRQMADNYNHLFELPLIFYAVVLAVLISGRADELHVWCAWGFVVSRVVHSLWHWTVNSVAVRFPLFALGWIFLIVMIVRELQAWLG